MLDQKGIEEISALAMKRWVAPRTNRGPSYEEFQRGVSWNEGEGALCQVGPCDFR